MEGTDSTQGVAQTFDLRKIDKRKGGSRFKKFGVVALVILLLGGGYFLYSYFRPMYVIDGISITRKDIGDYQQGLRDYKSEQPKVDFGKDLKKVATDDLVLNASYKAELKKRKDTSQDGIIAQLGKQERYGSEVSKKMQRVRAENNAYQKHLTPLILAQRDLTFVRLGFDTPFYEGKSPEQVKALREQSITTLNKTFIPLISAGAPKEQIASKADVNFLDEDRTDDQNYQQYFDKLVTVVEYQKDFIIGSSPLNDIDNQEYYGVKVDNLKNTTEEIAKLTKVGQYTPVFASKTGNYDIIRLEKIHGGSYKNWDDFLAQYKRNNAKSKLFAYDFSPSSAFNALADTAVLTLTNPGLQHAQAASCNSHGVGFVIKSYDLTAFVEMPGATVVNQYRRSHNCGNVFEGNRSSGILILDNCYGPAPTWSVLSYADPSKYLFVSQTTTIKPTESYAGWPIWNADNINEIGKIYINFYYIQKPQQQNNPKSGANLDGASCDRIYGWIYDDRVPGGNIQSPVEVHAYFDQPVGVAGGFGYNSGAANKFRPDVGAAFAGFGVGDNHGFDFNPSQMAGYNIRDGKDHEVWLYAANAGSYEITHRTIPACGPHPPSIGVDGTCDYFHISASDPDGGTGTFTYVVAFNNSGLNSITLNLGPAAGVVSVNPWPASGIELNKLGGTDWTVRATKVGGNGTTNIITGNIPPCPFSQNNITITPSTPVLKRGAQEDAENPDTAIFSAKFAIPTGKGMKGVKASCNYFIRPLTGSDKPLPGGENDEHYLKPDYICTQSVSLTNLVVGDQICATYKSTPGGARTDVATDEITLVTLPDIEPNPGSIAHPICKPVVNRPYVAFYGNDVFAGGGYGNDCHEDSEIRAFTNDGLAGSGVQFAASAMGAISGFNTARLRTGSKPLPPDDLKFANFGGNTGDFVDKHCLYDYYANMDADVPAIDKPESVITNLPTNKWKHTQAVTIGDGINDVTIGLGNKASLYVDGDVTIKSNIVYASDSGWATLADIPSLYLIIKGNLYIDPSVTRLDGMYIIQPGAGTPTGSMFTCSPATATHRFDPKDRFEKCNKNLTITGGIQAVRVYFDRVGLYSLRDANSSENTAGSSRGAEVINFSPEMYLTSPQIPRDSRGGGGSDNQNLEVLPPVL